MFEIDNTAYKVEVEELRALEDHEVGPMLEGARLVCESVQDNDMERWSFSRGGQFIRETGKALYVTDAAYALEHLAGWCEDKQMERLVSVGAFNGAVGAMPKF